MAVRRNVLGKSRARRIVGCDLVCVWRALVLLCFNLLLVKCHTVQQERLGGHTGYRYGTLSLKRCLVLGAWFTPRAGALSASLRHLKSSDLFFKPAAGH